MTASYYLNLPMNRSHGKALFLAEQHGAERLKEPPVWADIPANKAVICVIRNSSDGALSPGEWEAAAFCYDEAEFERFAAPDGTRRERIWLLLSKECAYVLSGYRQ